MLNCNFILFARTDSEPDRQEVEPAAKEAAAAEPQPKTVTSMYGKVYKLKET